MSSPSRITFQLISAAELDGGAYAAMDAATDAATDAERLRGMVNMQADSREWSVMTIYGEISNWSKNFFMILNNSAGKTLVQELAKLL